MDDYTPAIQAVLDKQIASRRDVYGNLLRVRCDSDQLILVFEDGSWASYDCNTDDGDIYITFMSKIQPRLEALLCADLITGEEYSEYHRLRRQRTMEEQEAKERQQLTELLKKYPQ